MPHLLFLRYDKHTIEYPAYACLSEWQNDEPRVIHWFSASALRAAHLILQLFESPS